MTTNCLMRPRESYKDRIYSTNVVGWEGVKHIGRKENGDKDFSEIIQQAIELGGVMMYILQYGLQQPWQNI